MTSKPRVVVIGAGAFGGWTALSLLRRGGQVTLIDAWGPGNLRSSSGGESRIIRSTYGPNQPYSKMAACAMQLWLEHEKRWKVQLLHRTGVLWLVTSEDDHFEHDSIPCLRDAGITFHELSGIELRRRWPQIHLEDARWGIHEPEGGFLRAQRACHAVVRGFLAEGGEYQQASVLTDDLESGVRQGITLGNTTKLRADYYVFACGPWLGKLFPETIGERIRVTKQDVFFFGPPAGDDSFSEHKLPVWGDHGVRFLYGMPVSDERGFKITDDTRGPIFDPTSGERVVSSDGLKMIREYMAFRFPAMKDAPLLETQVCQYEDTPDGHFIIDRHPRAGNVWIAGGGSGHGFKHGPAVGEMVAELLMDEKEPDPLFRLARFGGKK
jgi:sarcosine oxidase